MGPIMRNELRRIRVIQQQRVEKEFGSCNEKWVEKNQGPIMRNELGIIRVADNAFPPLDLGAVCAHYNKGKFWI